MTALCIDMSTKKLGWCCDAPGANRPRYGLIDLPGPRHIGRLNCAVRNSLSDLIQEFRPEAIAWCLPYFSNDRAQMNTTIALIGVTGIAELVAFDNRVRPFSPSESTVCADVLGCGQFGERNAKGRIIKGTGTPLKKAAALRWCAANGFETDSDDVADSIVLWEHVRRRLAMRRAA